MSLRALARELKVSEAAIRKGIKTGRLSRSVERNSAGRPVIVDVELAREEWRANATKAGKRGTVTLNEAQRQVAIERARSLRLANDQKRGTLINAAKAQREAFDAARTVRDSVLNIPARLAAELAAESDAARVHVRLETELRLALEGAAHRLSA